MEISLLFESAKKLSNVSEQCACEYFEKSEKFVAQMNIAMASRPDIEMLIGNSNLEMMKDNHANHARFIASILKNRNDEVLIETIIWVFHAYRSHGFTTNYWAAQLNTWIEVLRHELSPGCYKEICTYYEWMQVNIPIFVALSNERMAE